MTTLKEFRKLRLSGDVTRDDAEDLFAQVFEQLVKARKNMSLDEIYGYADECRRWRDEIGLIKAKEIMAVINNSNDSTQS